MTTTTENAGTETKSNSKLAGSVFRHKKGGGFNFTMSGKRYVAFPAKNKKANGPDLYIFEQPAKGEAPQLPGTEQPAAEGAGA